MVGNRLLEAPILPKNSRQEDTCCRVRLQFEYLGSILSFCVNTGQNQTISIQMTPSHQIQFEDISASSAAEVRTLLEQKYEAASSFPFHLFVCFDLAKVEQYKSLCI